jgi:prepilin-type N-terminal cleavage/methylation domain-containing protein/prepilin-type processing-associated H-X9-DG protein
MPVRRRGFTLIELLVVIAIIAILAAMLFPVFARARESARKIQCLSNVKNIAIAFQMYLTDYDRMVPFEHSADVAAWVNDRCGAGSCDEKLHCRGTSFNPYLKVPVILDEYVKNRDVWRCPSAIYTANSVSVNPCEPGWLAAAKAAVAAGECRVAKCGDYPPGWGGSITDSGKENVCGDGSTGAFDQSILVPHYIRDMKTSQMEDVTKQLVCGDGGTDLEPNWTSALAFPDYNKCDHLLQQCGNASGNCSTSSSCGNPTVAAQCSPLSMCFGGDGKFATDVSERKKHTRHMGGSNMGFADGHAAWWDSERILFGGEPHTKYAMNPPLYYGLQCCFIAGPTKW